MRIRTLILLVIFAVVALAAFWRGRPLQRAAQTYMVLFDDGPTAESVLGILETAPDAAGTIVQFWDSDKIPHRSLSMNYLRRRPDVILGDWQRIEPMVNEGLVSGDLDVQAAALRTLWRVDHDTACRWALRMSKDVDPGVRRIGLLFMADNIEDRRLVAPMLEMLDDPDPAIVAIAAATLRNSLGRDCPIRYTATPEQINEGRRIWREWWQTASHEFPPALLPIETVSLNSRALPAPGFALDTIEGLPIDLAQLRGKVVLLNFWATWSPPCETEVPALAELANKYSDKVVVLGVSLDGFASGDSADGVVEKVRTFASKHKMTYPVLIDGSGEVSRRFGGEVLPTTAWVDASGVVRRRYVSPRTLPAMERLLAEMTTPAVTTAVQ
jgi:thiol-disulfide isomerase/thioredoxin